MDDVERIELHIVIWSGIIIANVAIFTSNFYSNKFSINSSVSNSSKSL